MINISIQIKEFDKFSAKLHRIGVDLADFTDELTKAGADLVDYFSTVPFVTKGRSYSTGGWPEVTPKRLAYKLKHFPQTAHATLQATGTMRNSFKFVANRNLLTVMNETDYFKDHQLGLGHMPQRVMMAVNQKNREMVIKDIESGIQAKINRVK